MTPHLDCPRCHGYGEVAVPGTYGPTISPELLELIRCPRCEGTGEFREEQEGSEPPDEGFDS